MPTKSREAYQAQVARFQGAVARDAVRQAFAELAEAVEDGDIAARRKAEKRLSQARKVQRRSW